MKRHPELIRAIILKLEAQDEDSSALEVPLIDGYTHKQVGEHVRLAQEAGLLEAMNLCDQQDLYFWAPRRLTNLGHDFAQAVRDDTGWKRMLDAVGPRVERVATNVLSTIIGSAMIPK